jgi:hypothetical protein
MALEDVLPPLPRPFLDKVNEKAQDTFITDMLENPMNMVEKASAGLELLNKILPTLPGETVVPIPRGLYDKLKESGTLPGGTNAGQK